MPWVLTPNRLVRLKALVLIRVWIILDVLRQHLPVDPGCRLVTGCPGIGSFDPTHHAGYPTQKRCATYLAQSIEKMGMKLVVNENPS
ncbi:hypothetical protein SAMN05421863_102953 [Nitrosomonas communis]|uniref:Uncharacterized protein n=1 Tax=Nitrosomonas communis TaxID=44574 RepID=A0A1I4R0N1_9PROT|nr:hypothetical protein [Nitrosomonas communis]SFM45838.1 hypothetical protein SAMN05421863_102953 [Nitrosomonas communis]